LQGGTFIPTGSDNVAAAPEGWGLPAASDLAMLPRKSLPNDAMRQYELTPRQWEVLGLLGNGKSNKAIAKDLGMQETTVKAHIKQIMKKLNVENRTQAALFAVRHGAVENRTSTIF
jgi:DNA-binding NarL/FixJ family response regulator